MIDLVDLRDPVTVAIVTVWAVLFACLLTWLLLGQQQRHQGRHCADRPADADTRHDVLEGSDH